MRKIVVLLGIALSAVLCTGAVSPTEGAWREFATALAGSDPGVSSTTPPVLTLGALPSSWHDTVALPKNATLIGSAVTSPIGTDVIGAGSVTSLYYRSDSLDSAVTQYADGLYRDGWHAFAPSFGGGGFSASNESKVVILCSHDNTQTLSVRALPPAHFTV